MRELGSREVLCGAILLWAVTLSGCCKQSAADVLILNNTDDVVVATLSNRADEEVTIEAGTMGLGIAPPGEAKLILKTKGGELVKEIPVTLRFEDTGLVTARPGSCLVVADYTEQYGDRSGHVKATVKVNASTAGRLMRHNIMILLGPEDVMPAELTERATLHRLVEVECALLDDEKALEHHLAHLK